MYHDRCRTTLTSSQLPTWNLTINTTYPTFFYCGAPGSCINWAMVGAINADAEHPIATQIQSARVSRSSTAYLMIGSGALIFWTFLLESKVRLASR
jgi:hypothetical protein